MSFGLPQDTISQMHEVFRKYPQIDEVIIYGSRAQGNYRPGSDIDLTLIGADVTGDVRAKVWLDLDELNIPYIVDLSVLAQLTSDSLIDHIRRAGKIFYTSEG
jgi:uncharacterized protein